MEYLEQLVTEWYEYKGYFVRRDLWVGLAPDGSYECELDVVAYHAEDNHLVQVEILRDALSWESREDHFRTKFDAGRKYLHRVVAASPPPTLEQIALIALEERARRRAIAGARIIWIPDLLAEILGQLRGIAMASNVAPDRWPLLHTLHYVAEFRDTVCDVLMPAKARRTT